MHNTVRLVLVDQDDLNEVVTWVDCCVCGCPEMYATTDACGRVWDGDPVACSNCGAMDLWSADEDGVHLMHVPDVIDQDIKILRRVFLDTGHKDWKDRAREMGSAGPQYVIVDDGIETPLLAMNV